LPGCWGFLNRMLARMSEPGRRAEAIRTFQGWKLAALLGWVVITLLACGEQAVSSELPALSLLPPRVADVDTSAVTSEVRQNGGDVFVKLTGFPGSDVLQHLSSKGLGPPSGRSALVVLARNTVGGFVPAGGVDKIAAVSYVVRITPAADLDGVHPQT
jgi:hypothetical protein